MGLTRKISRRALVHRSEHSSCLTLPDAALVTIDEDGQCPDTRPQGKHCDAGSITMNQPAAIQAELCGWHQREDAWGGSTRRASNSELWNSKLRALADFD